MGKHLKRRRTTEEESESHSGSEFDEDRDTMKNDVLPDGHSDDYDSDENGWEGKEESHDEDDEDGDGDEEDDDDDDEEEEEEGKEGINEQKDEEMAQLEKEYMELQHAEQDVLKNLKRHKDEDLLIGRAVKNQKALWDKTLEFRFLLQKAFSYSNRLPQEPIKSSFCSLETGVNEAYSDLITSSQKTLDSILELQEVLLDKNPTIAQSAEAGSAKNSNYLEASGNSNGEGDEEWLRISEMQLRMASFRNKSIDKWQRKTQVTSGAASFKGRLHAFNQNISEQVALYMRDPSKMIKGMQQDRSAVAQFGNVLGSTVHNQPEVISTGGDPELLDDSDFYQQLLKEFFETVDPNSSEAAFYAVRRLQAKKRKIVDRRASKSRKIRYHVHEKLVNFMAPLPADIPPMAPKLFENLFGLKTQRPAV
ncbi:uncharacterized protein [Coffea arabica]